MDIDKIRSLGIVGIVRRSLSNSENTFDKFGSLRDDALIRSMKDVPGLSMNLLGNNFKPKYISYILSNKAGGLWIGKEEKLWLKYIKYLNYERKPTPIYFFLHDLHNKTFPYRRKDDKETRKFIKELNIDTVKDQDDNLFKIYGASLIKHRPNKLNYWHIEFVLFDIEPRNAGAKEIKPSKVKTYDENEDIKTQHWATQSAFYALQDILSQSAFKSVELKECALIDKSFFLN